jgi:hypothetical protein
VPPREANAASLRQRPGWEKLTMACPPPPRGSRPASPRDIVTGRIIYQQRCDDPLNSRTHRSVDCDVRASYLGTRRLACQDDYHWLASSCLVLQRCKAKIRPAYAPAGDLQQQRFSSSSIPRIRRRSPRQPCRSACRRTQPLIPMLTVCCGANVTAAASVKAGAAELQVEANQAHAGLSCVGSSCLPSWSSPRSSACGNASAAS